jgi:hypothetical protein
LSRHAAAGSDERRSQHELLSLSISQAACVALITASSLLPGSDCQVLGAATLSISMRATFCCFHYLLPGRFCSGTDRGVATRAGWSVGIGAAIRTLSMLDVLPLPSRPHLLRLKGRQRHPRSSCHRYRCRGVLRSSWPHLLPVYCQDLTARASGSVGCSYRSCRHEAAFAYGHLHLLLGSRSSIAVSARLPLPGAERRFPAAGRLAVQDPGIARGTRASV